MNKRQDLIDAVELIGKYIDVNLPADFLVLLDFRRDEASIELFDHDDMDTGFFPLGDDASVVEACDWAKDMLKKKGDECE